MTHLQRPWCWERLKAGEKGTTEDKMVGWHYQLNGRVWVSSGIWWWTGTPGVLQFMGWQSRTWLNDWYKLSWSHVQLLVTPWTVACQVPLSIGFPRQEYLSWIQRIFPTYGSKSCFLCFLYQQADFLPLRHLGSIFTLLGRMEVVLISTSCRRERGRTRCKISVSFLGKDHRWPGLIIKSVHIMHCSSWYSVKVIWF